MIKKQKAAPEAAHRYPTRVEVEEANNARLAQIMEDEAYFDAVDRPGFGEKGKPVSLRVMARLLNRLVALPIVVLKVIRVTFRCDFHLISARPAHKSCSSRHVLSLMPAQSCNFDFRTLSKAVWLMDPLVG